MFVVFVRPTIMLMDSVDPRWRILSVVIVSYRGRVWLDLTLLFFRDWYPLQYSVSTTCSAIPTPDLIHIIY